MSRCFPFPPPGYQRKTKVDDTDLLKKEKQKEKKHKKEKKDKEKKEGKEKREKERSDEKHKEKKEKREKHRDKKKDKEKDRDKHKNKSDLLLSDEKKVVGSADNHGYKLSEKSRERETDRNATSAEKRIGGVSGVHNGMLVSKNNHQVHETKSFKHMPDLVRKSMDEERKPPNQSSDKNVGAERKKDGGVVMLAAKSGEPLQDTKERTKEKPALDGRLDGRGVIGDTRSTGSASVPNFTGLVSNPGGLVQKRVAGNRPVEKKIAQKVDAKEKVREKEGEDRKGEKRKEKDREKPILKDKDREKEKKMEEIMKAASEEKNKHMTITKDGGENHMLKSTLKDAKKKDQSAGIDNITKDNNYHAANVNNNLRKRKDPGLNGIYDELVTGPNKLARASASPHPLTENGRSLEHCQNPSALTPGTQRLPGNIKVEPHLPRVDSTQKPPMKFKVEPNLPQDSTQKPPMKIKVDGKECKISGTVPKMCTQSTRGIVPKAEQKSSDALAKPPPHPDTKYLGQVLSVPKMDEWSDFDDQEWLFDSNNSLTRKPTVKSSLMDDTPQVWARGLWLEPVDTYALPYVIPH